MVQFEINIKPNTTSSKCLIARTENK